MAKKKVKIEEIDVGTTLVRFCSCRSLWQDSVYGKSKRVHNKGLKTWCCTVCGVKKGE